MIQFLKESSNFLSATGLETEQAGAALSVPASFLGSQLNFLLIFCGRGFAKGFCRG